MQVLAGKASQDKRVGSWGLFKKIASVLIQNYNPDLFNFYYNLGRWGNGSSGKRQEF